MRVQKLAQKRTTQQMEQSRCNCEFSFQSESESESEKTSYGLLRQCCFQTIPPLVLATRLGNTLFVSFTKLDPRTSNKWMMTLLRGLQLHTLPHGKRKWPRASRSARGHRSVPSTASSSTERKRRKERRFNHQKSRRICKVNHRNCLSHSMGICSVNPCTDTLCMGLEAIACVLPSYSATC